MPESNTAARERLLEAFRASDPEPLDPTVREQIDKEILALDGEGMLRRATTVKTDSARDDIELLISNDPILPSESERFRSPRYGWWRGRRG